MKSINEFATEYAQDKYMPVQTSQAVKAGANYVIEEIEKCVKSSSNSRLKIDTIKQIIEQLKK